MRGLYVVLRLRRGGRSRHAEFIRQSAVYFGGIVKAVHIRGYFRGRTQLIAIMPLSSCPRMWQW
jgi:hypothetical protein